MTPSRKLPEFQPVLFTGLLMLSIGWIGIFLVVFFSVPNIGPRWLFFFLLTLAISGSALPFIYVLNRRFPATPAADSGVLLRQALLVGAYFDLMAWLAWGKALTLPLAVLIGGGLFLFEYLLRLQNRSKFLAEHGSDEPPA